MTTSDYVVRVRAAKAKMAARIAGPPIWDGERWWTPLEAMQSVLNEHEVPF